MRRAYKLALPPAMVIYKIFDVSLREPYQNNRYLSQIKDPPALIQVEGGGEYQLNEIFDY